MQIRFFTISTSVSDSDELNSFLRSHRVSGIEKQFVSDGSASFWSVCVTWVEGASPIKQESGGKKRIDYRNVLNEHDFAVFAQVRELRKSLSEKEAVPAYALFTNEQLAEMVRRQVRTKKALGEIDGVGEARVEKYADIFLAKLEELQSKQTNAAAKSNDD